MVVCKFYRQITDDEITSKWLYVRLKYYGRWGLYIKSQHIP